MMSPPLDMPFLFAQLTDIHLCLHSPESKTRLNLTLEEVRHHNPAFLLITGDVISGESDARTCYRELKQILDSYDVPYYIVPGNHDLDVPAMKETFHDHALDHIAFIHNNVLFIGLNSSVEHQHQGRITPEHLHFLETTLKEKTYEAVVIFLHHPPFTLEDVPSGLPDEYKKTLEGYLQHNELENNKKLFALLKTIETPILILTGHTHFGFVAKQGNITYLSSPSVAPCNKYFLGHKDVFNPMGLSASESPAYNLIRYSEKGFENTFVFIEVLRMI